jgi:predicted RNA-binding Zn-ribbon protein involved in translation (DUF1610 family)
MQDVRLHLTSSGEVWAMTQCRVCGDVDKFLIARAMESPVPCKKCGHRMDIRDATIRATGEDPRMKPDVP